MAGSLGQAVAIISSVNPGGIGSMATAFRSLGSASATAGSTLTGSAGEVGAQYGAPYAAYEERLAPVGTWLQHLERPITETASALENAQTVSQQAQWVLAEVLASLARMAAGGPDAGAMAAAEAQALARLNAEIQKMSSAFAAIEPAQPGAAPVQARGGGTSPDASGTSESQAGSQAADQPGDQAGEAAAAAGAGAVGPQSGPYSGWVQDPTTGNLVDPATGREVDAGGRFVDPVTGEPFGDPSEYASRLEGLQGGVGTTGGLLSAGPAGLPPAPAGIGGGGGGGIGAMTGFYGGLVPPSLVGRNPAAPQLRQKARENLELRADTAQRYAAIAGGAGQSTGAYPYSYMPPVAGMGGAPFGGNPRRTSRPGKQMVSEPASVWGATGRGARAKPREQASGGTEVVEDTDVWTGGAPVRTGMLGGR